MDFFIQRFSRTCLIYILSVLCFISFPAFSATSMPPFGALNLAFIIGLSLPVITLSLWCQFKTLFKLRFFILLVLSLIGMLYFVIFSNQENITSPLIFSILFLIFSYFGWTSERVNSINNITMFSNAIVLILTATYIAVTWFYPNEYAYILWSVSSAVILILLAVRIKHASKHLTLFIIKMITQWLPSVYFSSIVFLWIQREINNDWLILNSTACYTVFLFVNCRLLVKNINEENSSNKMSLNLTPAKSSKIASDTTTNLRLLFLSL